MIVRTLLIILLGMSNAVAFDLDDKIDLIKRVYHLQPKECTLPQKRNTVNITAGEALFNSKLLSGNEDIACANCHLDKFGTADGLPLAVGVGGEGEGVKRYNSQGTLVQRNALSLVGRGSPEFTAFFWDGKAQRDGDRIVTQFGDSVRGFKSALAAAAILPLVERDEFLGKTDYLASNDFQAQVKDKVYYDKYLAVSKSIKQRILNSSEEEAQAIRQKLLKANVDIGELELVDVGNLLADFIASKFHCNESDWDRYLNGERDALTEDQKEGAVIFYGKGRCASCHEGSFFSDFAYHSIGAPQGAFGPHSRHRDIGRAGVTNRATDLYKFRTPPLVEVAKTSPYGHNGAFQSLEEIVTHHYNPFAFYLTHPQYYKEDSFMIGKFISSRDKLLSTIDIGSDDEIKKVVSFLEAL